MAAEPPSCFFKTARTSKSHISYVEDEENRLLALSVILQFIFEQTSHLAELAFQKKKWMEYPFINFNPVRLQWLSALGYHGCKSNAKY